MNVLVSWSDTIGNEMIPEPNRAKMPSASTPPTSGLASPVNRSAPRSVCWYWNVTVRIRTMNELPMTPMTIAAIGTVSEAPRNRMSAATVQIVRPASARYRIPNPASGDATLRSTVREAIISSTFVLSVFEISSPSRATFISPRNARSIHAWRSSRTSVWSLSLALRTRVLSCSTTAMNGAASVAGARSPGEGVPSWKS